MWIHSSIGFFSAVRDHFHAGHVLVRARFQEDIERLADMVAQPEFAGAVPKIERTPDRDYLFRISIGNLTWGHVLQRLGEEITYTNFKSSVHGDRVRDDAYAECWRQMRKAQQHASERPLKKV